MWFRKKTAQDGPSRDELRDLERQGAQRAEQTQRALAAGQLPAYVTERIARQRDGQMPWTSDLSVNEWLTLARLRMKPLGMVMGSSFYHVAYTVANRAGTWYSYDLHDLEQALYAGRQLALQRLAQEAALLGANAVVGVRIQTKQPGFYGHETEFVAIGTAVAMEGLPAPHDPVLCTVSGEDLLRLLRDGTLPVGLLMGVCVHYQYTSQQDKWQLMSWSNQEVPTYTDAIYHTRNRAVKNMWDEARRVGASGVLAHDTKLTVMEIEVERGQGDEREDHVVEFMAIGTAVAAERAPRPIMPELIMDMRG